MTKTVNIEIELYKKIKIFCANNDLKIREFVQQSLEKKLEENDNNENGKDKNEK